MFSYESSFLYCAISDCNCVISLSLYESSLTKRETVFAYNDDFVPTAGFCVNRDHHHDDTPCTAFSNHIVVIMFCRPTQHMKKIALMRVILTTPVP